MTSGISAATTGIQLAMRRYDAAAAVVAKGVDSETPDVASEGGELETATVTMITARLAFHAALVAARTSHEMLTETISLGGYGDLSR